MAVRRSEHLASRAASRAESEHRGAPRGAVSEELIQSKRSMGPSSSRRSREMTTHFETLRLSSCFAPFMRDRLTPEETVVLGPPRLISSMKLTVSEANVNTISVEWSSRRADLPADLLAEDLAATKE